MEFLKETVSEACIESSSFCKNHVDELHFYVKGTRGTSFREQARQIRSGIFTYLDQVLFPVGTVMFIRLFASDYANQEDELKALEETLVTDFGGCAVSIVQQPPLEGSKLVAWVYAIRDGDGKTVSKRVEPGNSGFVCRRNGYAHVWNTRLKASDSHPDSGVQTHEIFSDFDAWLGDMNLNIRDNCLRTWLFVKDIDYNYKGVVDARLAYFERLDMTKDTHYIASTGIDGRISNPCTSVIMDAYSLGGISTEQIKFLQAPDHLNPTHEYGVTFERGTAVDFGDRRHIFISGTASINNKGEVVHAGDVRRQAGRTLENICALLADADAALADIAQMVVYLRDVNDTDIVTQYLEEHASGIPRVVVLAPVCRPGWLIEIECVAVKDISKPEYCNF